MNEIKRLKLIFAIGFIAFAGILLVIILVIYNFDRTVKQMSLDNEEHVTLSLAVASVLNAFERASTDLAILADHDHLYTILDSPVLTSKKALEREFILFAEKKKRYDQIRYIDKKGMEIVRVNYSNGRATVVPDERLQSKADRYYFTEASKYGPDEVALSRFDLNIEGKAIERPYKPMVRLTTPVFDRRNRRQGIIVMNLLGERILTKIENASKQAFGDVLLVDSEGYWLKGLTQDDEWGFMFAGGKNKRFANRFPGVWAEISANDSGTVRNSFGVFSYQTIRPLEAIYASLPTKTDRHASMNATRDYYWKLIAYVPAERLAESVYGMNKTKYAAVYVIVMVVFGAGMLMTLNEALRRKAAQEELRISEERFRLMAGALNDVFWMGTPDFDRLIYVSPAYETMWGRSLNSIYNDPRSFVETIHPDDRQIVSDDLKKGTQGDWDRSYRIVRPDGAVRWIHDRGYAIKDSSGAVRMMTGIATDITDTKLLEEKLKHLAGTDTLTQAFNRLRFNEILEREIDRAGRYGHPLSIIILDLDRFKEINDTRGHLVGDRALINVAGIARHNLRASDILARWGGEEFSVIAPNTPLSDALLLAERIRAAIESGTPHKGYPVTASFGVAEFTIGDTADSLVTRADKALYRAKENGRNRVEAG